MIWVTPYIFRKWNAETFHCWELVRQVYSMQLGIDLPNFPGVDPLQSVKVAQTIAENIHEWIPTNDLEPFALVTMGRNGVVAHVGVVAAPGRVLHVCQGHFGKVETVQQLKAAGFSNINFFRHAKNCNH